MDKWCSIIIFILGRTKIFPQLLPSDDCSSLELRLSSLPLSKCQAFRVQTSSNYSFIWFSLFLYRIFCLFRRPDGQECTVSLNDLSPCPREVPNSDEIPVTRDIIRNSLPNNEVPNNAPVVDEPELQNMPIERNLRLSSRTNKGVPPARYGEQ